MSSNLPLWRFERMRRSYLVERTADNDPETHYFYWVTAEDRHKTYIGPVKYRWLRWLLRFWELDSPEQLIGKGFRAPHGTDPFWWLINRVIFMRFLYANSNKKPQ